MQEVITAPVVGLDSDDEMDNPSSIEEMMADLTPSQRLDIIENSMKRRIAKGELSFYKAEKLKKWIKQMRREIAGDERLSTEIERLTRGDLPEVV